MPPLQMQWLIITPPRHILKTWYSLQFLKIRIFWMIAMFVNQLRVTSWEISISKQISHQSFGKAWFHFPGAVLIPRLFEKDITTFEWENKDRNLEKVFSHSYITSPGYISKIILPQTDTLKYSCDLVSLLFHCSSHYLFHCVCACAYAGTYLTIPISGEVSIIDIIFILL